LLSKGLSEISEIPEMRFFPGFAAFFCGQQALPEKLEVSGIRFGSSNASATATGLPHP